MFASSAEPYSGLRNFNAAHATRIAAKKATVTNRQRRMVAPARQNAFESDQHRVAISAMRSLLAVFRLLGGVRLRKRQRPIDRRLDSHWHRFPSRMASFGHFLLDQI